MFCKGDSYGRCRVSNVRSYEPELEKTEVRKQEAFAAWFIVWAGVSFFASHLCCFLSIKG